MRVSSCLLIVGLPMRAYLSTGDPGRLTVSIAAASGLHYAERLTQFQLQMEFLPGKLTGLPAWAYLSIENPGFQAIKAGLPVRGYLCEAT